MDQGLIDKAIQNIAAVLAQFRTEEMGNRLTQFNYLSLERFIMEELQKIKSNSGVTNDGGGGK